MSRYLIKIDSLLISLDGKDIDLEPKINGYIVGEDPAMNDENAIIIKSYDPGPFMFSFNSFVLDTKTLLKLTRWKRELKCARIAMQRYRRRKARGQS